MRIRLIGVCGAFCLCLSLNVFDVFAQAAKPPRVAVEAVECDPTLPDMSNKKTPVLISPSGHRAFGELRVAVKKRNADQAKCEATWMLNVAGVGRSYQAVELDSTEQDQGYGFDLELVGWSKDGTHLLVTLIQYAGDWDQTVISVYDTRSRSVTTVNPADVSPFKEIVRRGNCYVYFRPAGFTADSFVALDVAANEDLEPGQTPCFKASQWKIEPAATKAVLLPHGTRVQAVRHIETK